MKRWLRILLIAVGIGYCCGHCTETASAAESSTDRSSKSHTVTIRMVSERKGLYKGKNGGLYYYKNDERVTNTLIRTGGSTYYFGKNGKAVRNQWKTVDGRKYYFKKSGKAAVGSYQIKGKYYIFDSRGRLYNPSHDKVVKVDGKWLCVSKGGLALKGWQYIGGKVYHTNQAGKCAVNKKVSYIAFNKKGYAQNTDQALAKLMARDFIDQHSDKSLSKKERFRKCFRYIMAYTSYVPGWLPKNFGEKGWQYRAAISMFQTNLTGNCYGIASAVSAVAKELGYTPYEIWAAEDHAFVIIDGKYYDNMYGAVFGATSHKPYTVKEKFKF